MKKNLRILIGSFSMSIPMNLMILSDLQVLLIQAFLQTLMDANAFLLIPAVPRTRLLSLKEKKLLMNQRIMKPWLRMRSIPKI